jgi:hypothetical protein
MATKISERIRDVGRRIGEEIDNNVPDMPFTTEVQTKAVRAITGGAAERAEYMDLFAETEEELAHLTAFDDTDQVRQKARAYLISNGMCGSGSTRHIILNVEDTLDLP